MLAPALLTAHVRHRLADRCRDGEVHVVAPVADRRGLDGPVVVEGVARLEEDLLARDGEERADVLTEDLRRVQIWVVPVAFGQAQEVHQGVVFGIGVPLPNMDRDRVLLLEVLGRAKCRLVRAQRRARHLVDALLFELILLPPRLLRHHVDRVPRRLREGVHLLLGGYEGAQPEPDKLVEEGGAHKRLEEKLVVLRRLELGKREELVVVGQLLRRKVRLAHEQLVDRVHTREHRLVVEVLLACHRDQVDLVRVVVQVDELALPNLELRHEVVVAVLVDRALGPDALPHMRRELLVESEQLVLAQRVELGEAADVARDVRVEPEHQIGRAVLIVIRARELEDALFDLADGLERLCVERGGHLAHKLAARVRVQHLGFAVVLERARVLQLIVGHRQPQLLKVSREDTKIARVTVAMEVADQVAIRERAQQERRRRPLCRRGSSSSAGAASATMLHKKLKEQPAHGTRGIAQLVGVAHVNRLEVAVQLGAAHLTKHREQERLEVARVARQLRRHRTWVAPAVDEQPSVEVEAEGLQSNFAQ